MSKVEAFKDGKPVWHFHPVMFLGALKYDLINVSDFLVIYVKEHISFAPGISKPLSQKSYNNLKKLLDNINIYYSGTQDYKPNLYKLAYMLATVRHEAYNYIDMEYFSEGSEIGSVSYFNQYDPVLASTQDKKNRAMAYGNTRQGDGYKYRGRGCVHLTWKNNYQKAKEKFGVDFVNNPDLAADFIYAVPVMVWGMEEGIFTGMKISSYINSNSIDYKKARRVINGSDRDELISSYARKFQSILEQTSTAPQEF